MSGYVPYEQRRQAQEAARRRAADDINPHRALLIRDIRTFLRQGSTTGFTAASVVYLELLHPAEKYAQRFRRKSLIWKDPVRGGPYFEISQVLTACRIADAIVYYPPPADSSAYMPIIPTVSDALILPDGNFGQNLRISVGVRELPKNVSGSCLGKSLNRQFRFGHGKPEKDCPKGFFLGAEVLMTRAGRRSG